MLLIAFLAMIIVINIVVVGIVVVVVVVAAVLLVIVAKLTILLGIFGRYDFTAQCFKLYLTHKQFVTILSFVVVL